MKNTQLNELEHYCASLEEQYEGTKASGAFEVLRLMDLDEKNSDLEIVKAVNYFKENNGLNKSGDVPTGFLNQQEIEILKKGGCFRENLYCMLLSVKLAEAIENRKVFLAHSYQFAYDG